VTAPDSRTFETAAGHERLVEEAAASVRARLGGDAPPILVVAGSGLGRFATTLEDASSVSYSDLANFPSSTVVGHAGQLVWGRVGGRPVIVMSGRKHLYEGVDPRAAVLPLRALIAAGVRVVILSNAAGALNKRFAPGDLMLINDHVNFQFRNPLVGPNVGEGPRFPDLSAPYSPDLMDTARQAALTGGIRLHEGVYVAVSGPSYETQAEVAMLRQFADAVGMSTVPEAVTAIQCGARVLGISLITNSLVRKTGVVTTHEEVIEAGRAAGETFCRLVAAIIRGIRD